MSLQTGSELARTSREIINPKNLSIIAYELEGRLLDQHPSLLRIDDVREIGPLGMIIDSTDEIIGIDDVITIKEIYEINFALKDKLVIDEKIRKSESYRIYVGGWEFYYTTTPNSATVLEKFWRHRATYSSFSDHKSNRR